MRKRYHQKRRSCKVCHPDKRGIAPRWREREWADRLQWERERVTWLGRHGGVSQRDGEQDEQREGRG